MVDTTRLEGPRVNDAGGPTGRRDTPLWALLAMAIVAALVGGTGGYLWGQADTERAASAPQEWTYLGGPSLDRGGAYVYTRCAQEGTRLFLTVGGDGFPVGPATVQTGIDNGCTP